MDDESASALRSVHTDMPHRDFSLVFSMWLRAERQLNESDGPFLDNLAKLEKRVLDYARTYESRVPFGYQRYLHEVRRAMARVRALNLAHGPEMVLNFGEVDPDLLNSVFHAGHAGGARYGDDEPAAGPPPPEDPLGGSPPPDDGPWEDWYDGVSEPEESDGSAASPPPPEEGLRHLWDSPPPEEDYSALYGDDGLEYSNE